MITMADVLRGSQNDQNDQDDKTILEVIKSLGIKKKDLRGFKKTTSTATARNLIRSKYPNPPTHFGLGDIKRSTVNAIIRKFENLYFYN